jgi:hypothetical protein
LAPWRGRGRVRVLGGDVLAPWRAIVLGGDSNRRANVLGSDSNTERGACGKGRMRAGRAEKET